MCVSDGGRATYAGRVPASCPGRLVRIIGCLSVPVVFAELLFAASPRSGKFERKLPNIVNEMIVSGRDVSVAEGGVRLLRSPSVRWELSGQSRVRFYAQEGGA